MVSHSENKERETSKKCGWLYHQNRSMMPSGNYKFERYHTLQHHLKFFMVTADSVKLGRKKRQKKYAGKHFRSISKDLEKELAIDWSWEIFSREV